VCAVKATANPNVVIRSIAVRVSDSIRQISIGRRPSGTVICAAAYVAVHINISPVRNSGTKAEYAKTQHVNQTRFHITSPVICLKAKSYQGQRQRKCVPALRSQGT
jgi:hypothetical protein